MKTNKSLSLRENADTTKRASAPAAFTLTRETRGTSRWVPLCTWAWIFFLVIGSGGTRLSLAHGRDQRSARQDPIWRLDLHSLGDVPLPWHWDEQIRGSWVIGPLSFLGDGKIVVTYIGRGAPLGLPHRGQPSESLAYRLHALFVNADTGKVEASKEWPAASGRAGIIPTENRRFVVVTPDRLSLYGPDLSHLADLDISLTASMESDDDWGVAWSPDGKTMIIGYAEKREDFRYRRLLWVDLTSLKVVRSWEEDTEKNIWRGPEDFVVNGGCGGAIWDNVTARSFYRGLLVQHLGGPCTYVPLSVTVHDWTASFVSAGVLALVDSGGVGGAALAFVETGGRVFFQKHFGKNDIIWPLKSHLASSAGGGRVAVAVLRGRGGSELLDIGKRYSIRSINVYEVPGGAKAWSVTGRSEGIRNVGALALSPDGSLLALINQDGILEVFRVPKGPAPSQANQ